VGVTLDPDPPVVADVPAPRADLIESGPTFVKLSWNAVVGASAYVVYRNGLDAVHPSGGQRLASDLRVHRGGTVPERP
jgi:hypothetical protein